MELVWINGSISSNQNGVRGCVYFQPFQPYLHTKNHQPWVGTSMDPCDFSSFRRERTFLATCCRIGEQRPAGERTRTLRRFKGKPTGIRRKSHLGISMQTGWALFNVVYVCFFNGAAGLRGCGAASTFAAKISCFVDISSISEQCSLVLQQFEANISYYFHGICNILEPKSVISSVFAALLELNFAELCSSNLWLGPICLQCVRAEISSLQGTCSVVFLKFS